MSLTHLSDEALLASFQDLLIDERERLVLQLEYIMELDRRKLFLHHPSLRAYLVQENGMEESVAERKIRAARLMSRIPSLRKQLESGKMNLTLMELAMGCAHREKLSDPELAELLDAISGMSCRRAMREIATRYPRYEETPRDRIRPIDESRSEVRFVADQDLLDKLDEIRGLLAHAHPHLSLAELIDILATEYRDRHHPEEKAKRAAARKAKNEGKAEMPSEPLMEPTAPWVERRTPSQAQVHELTLTDGYRCAFFDPITKQRCTSTYALEIDHCQAWAFGGKTEVANLRYLCANHHRRVTFLQFGAQTSEIPISAPEQTGAP